MQNTAHGLHMSDVNSTEPHNYTSRRIQAHDQNVLSLPLQRVYISNIKLCLKMPYNEFRNQSVSRPNERFRPIAHNGKLRKTPFYINSSNRRKLVQTLSNHMFKTEPEQKLRECLKSAVQCGEVNCEIQHQNGCVWFGTGLIFFHYKLICLSAKLNYHALSHSTISALQMNTMNTTRACVDSVCCGTFREGPRSLSPIFLSDMTNNS